MVDSVSKNVEYPSLPRCGLDEIARLDQALELRFRDRIRLDPFLSRQLVSYQANKKLASYRWYKYKEAFSAPLVEHCLNHYGIRSGVLLDPFAGSGTALFAAAGMGLEAHGIELLPVGREIINARLLLETAFTVTDFQRLEEWASKSPWEETENRASLPTLRITDGAYPQDTVEAIERYTGSLGNENERVQAVLRFALLCVLESVSFTRKDGQYLRWDDRSGRRAGRRVGTKPFCKGPIPGFREALSAKLVEILTDVRAPVEGGLSTATPRALPLFEAQPGSGSIRVYTASCLDVLPTLTAGGYDVIVTSPPYCNRYDYTRTYALELALLGADEKGLVDLRQRMLSCTVENRAKDLLAMNAGWARAVAATDAQQLLQAILSYLEELKAEKRLNNNGIPRMVRGYFYELACVIAECARVLVPGGLMVMVNDNVRYAGVSVSVDLISSDLAEQLGFRAESILVLPKGKGNSSQQMGAHGRAPLRKCLYVWRRA